MFLIICELTFEIEVKNCHFLLECGAIGANSAYKCLSIHIKDAYTLIIAHYLCS